jgi:hypothetical protein
MIRRRIAPVVLHRVQIWRIKQAAILALQASGNLPLCKSRLFVGFVIHALQSEPSTISAASLSPQRISRSSASVRPPVGYTH